MNVGLEKYIGVFATYSDLFGFKYSKSELIKLINDLPLGGIITILSQMSSMPVDEKNIRNRFLSFVQSIDTNNTNFSLLRNKLEKNVLYSNQGLLALWKWLFAYGDEKKLDNEIEINKGTNLILYLNLIVSDYLYDEKRGKSGLEYDLFSNMIFNSQQNFSSAITRACYIYIELAQRKEYYQDKEFIDFNQDFIVKYGYSIKEYLAVVLGLFAGFNKRNRNIDEVWGRKQDNYFSDTNITEKAKVIIQSLSVSYKEVREWAKKTIDSPFDFSLFRQKPILMLDDGFFIPISVQLVYEQAFTELFYKIRQAYPKEDTRFLSFIGRPFEIYVEQLVKKAVETSKFPYQVISEFRFGSKNEKLSPDVMLRMGNKLLAIEAKNHRLKMDSVINADKGSIETDIEKMVISPMLQLEKCIDQLTQENHPVLDGVEEIYLMTVTLGEFPTITPIEKKIIDTLYKSFKQPIKAIYHLDIEEFEMMCYLISRGNAKPIFRTLDNKINLMPNLPFKNFIMRSSLPIRRMHYFHEKFLGYFDEMKDILFSNRE